MSAKVSVFYSKFNKTFPKSSQRFYLAQTLIKHKKTQPKQCLDNLFITKQEKIERNTNKIGLPPNKRYRLTPLARHKSKDRSNECHNNKIDLENSSHILYVRQQASFEATKSNQKG